VKVSGGDTIFTDDGASASVSASGRGRRLLQGWSANLLQMLLGITQQVALVPIFLNYWKGEELAAWLTIYAAGNLILIADCGLHVRAINKFLSFRSSANCDERTADFFAAVLRIYLALTGLLVIPLLVAMLVFPPSASLGFAAIPHFDMAFAIMILGMLLTVLGNPAAALYRARGYYGRAVRLQCLGMLVAQIGQLTAVTSTGSLLAVTLAYVIPQLLVCAYVVVIDAPRLFLFLREASGTHSWRWAVGQFRMAFPFAVAAATDLALTNAPVLLVSAFVSDRIAVAQWGLTRVVAGLLRALCLQTTLPLAAELGHDYAIGETEKLRVLYARGSILVAALAGLVTSGLLAFWPDFFSIWTRGAIPYDPLLTMTLLIGTAVAAPAILAASYANYSNRGKLLASTKSLQLVVFMVLSVVLVSRLGPLGVALAIVGSDVVVQLGWLTLDMMRQTLKRPFEHAVFLVVLVAAVTLGGWGLGIGIRGIIPGTGLFHLVSECALWLLGAVMVASPLSNEAIRDRLAAAIPR
jgi:O-antigen/teichoic acid export membrane protein